MTHRSLERAVLLAGVAGTFVFVLAGVGNVLSRVWAMSFTQTLEVAVAAPFLAGWVLAPVLWTIRPRDGDDAPEQGSVADLAAACALVGVAAVAYVYEFVALPRLSGEQPGWSSLLVIAVVPAVQWAILGVAALAGRRRAPTA